MKIYTDVYNKLLSSFSVVPPERGAILGSRDGKIVSDFVLDRSEPEYARAVYTPNIEFLNQQIAEWEVCGIIFCGLLHTHPENCEKLSFADQRYIRRVMLSFDRETTLLFPVLIPFRKIIPYAATGSAKKVAVFKTGLTLINGVDEQ